MGFSLKSALVGAIQGGARAVGEIADQQIKEQANARALAAAAAAQRESDIFRDELLANRERRVDELKMAREGRVQQAKTEALRAGLAALRESKIDPGSVKGQQMLATKLGDAGYVELADKYFDNAIRLGQIESTNELKKAEASYRHAAIAESRADRAERSKGTDFGKQMGVVEKLAQRIRIPDPSNPDKSIPFAEAAGPLVSLFSDAVAAGKSNAEALTLANRAQTLATTVLRNNPDADPFTVVRKSADQALLDEGLMGRGDFDKLWSPQTPQPAAEQTTSPRQTPAPKKPIAGIFNNKLPAFGEGYIKASDR